MQTLKILRYAFISTLLFSAGIALAADKQQDQEQLHDQQRLQDRDRLHINTDDPQHLQVQQQKRVQNQERSHEQKSLQIYGAQLMSPEELARYKQQYNSLQSEGERNQFKYQHQITMQKRAQATGVPMPVESPVQLQNTAGRTVSESPAAPDSSSETPDKNSDSSRHRSSSGGGFGQGGNGGKSGGGKSGGRK